MIVAGADISKGKWAVVVLTDGRFLHAFRLPALADILELRPEIVMLAVDIPIGLVTGNDDWPRQADLAAKKLLGSTAAAVFFAPPRPVLDCDDYNQANRLHRKLTGVGMSQQTWGLKAGTLEAEGLAESDDRVIEAHPEVSFLKMVGNPLLGSKRTWNGQMQRRSLLAEQGVIIPDVLEGAAGKLPPDDLLDAAAAAWTAHRFEIGRAESLGAPTPDGKPNLHAGRIWY